MNTKTKTIHSRIEKNVKELTKSNNEEYTNLAMIIESTGENGKVSEENLHI